MYMNNGLGMRIILTQINLISPNLQGYSCLRPVAGILSKFGSFACTWKCDACGIATFVTAYVIVIPWVVRLYVEIIHEL